MSLRILENNNANTPISGRMQDNGIISVSNNGKHLVTFESTRLIILNSCSLEVHRSLQLVCSVAFSPNSEILSFITKSPYRLCVFHIEEDHIVEIDIDANLDVVQTIWSPNSQQIAYCSELGVYTGILDTVKNEHFILKGCSQVDSNACLIDFTPQSDYLCVTSGFQINVYDTDSLEEVTFKTSVYPSILTCSLFYSIVFANNEGVFRVYTLFGRIVLDEKFYPTSCVKCARFSYDWSSLFAVTYDNMIIIYDVASWNKIAVIKVESYFQERFFKIFEIDNERHFEDFGSFLKFGRCCPTDEFRLKTTSAFRIEPSPDGKYIATYHPGVIPFCSVWIWRLANARYLEAVVSLNDSKLMGMNWHEKRIALAIVSDSGIVFWEPGMYTLVSMRIPNAHFRWIKSKRKIGLVSSDCTGSLVYFN